MFGGTGYNFQVGYRNRPKGTRVLHDVKEGNAHKKPMKRHCTVYFEKGLLACLMMAVLTLFLNRKNGRFRYGPHPKNCWPDIVK